MTDLSRLREALDGELLGPVSPGYDEVRQPVNARYADVRPRLVLLCRSVSDVVRAVEYARTTGTHVVARGGGHCFAGRSSTDGIVLDLRGLDTISVADDGIATIGAGARLAQVYAALHEHGRTIPAGCGDTVGITGLTLGGGIGLLGRRYGLTCDHLVGALVVLADGRIVDTDQDNEPELFWALRGAGGGQFGIVTSLVFDTVAEPTTTRFEAHWSDIALEELVPAWQAWAPDAADGVTANLTVVAEPGRPVQATLFGASLIDEGTTGALLREFTTTAGPIDAMDLRGGLPYHQLKRTFDDLDPRDAPGTPPRIRSEFFSRPLRASTVSALIDGLTLAPSGARRQLTFTAMGGAYNRPSETATAFAHRDEHFLLEHIAAERDPWLDWSWATTHADGSGRVYPNFPDPELDDPLTAYHGANLPRLTAVKEEYDPSRLFRFPQSLNDRPPDPRHDGHRGRDRGGPGRRG